MDGCVQGAWAPHRFETISFLTGWRQEKGEEGSLLGTSEEKHLPGSSRSHG